MMEYENGIEGIFKEFHRISETKEKFIQELILAGTLASHLRGSCLCGISPHLIKAIVNHYSTKRRKLSEVHVNTSNRVFATLTQN